MRMMTDRPWLGYGWGQGQMVYEEKYRPPQLENGAAIQMNDFFMLGISTGVPALICFVVYVGLSLRSPRASSRIDQGDEETKEGRIGDPRLAWMQATCRAGAIVLLVGFWFDGGLFKLATGSVFWILLELGRGESRGPSRGGGMRLVSKEQEDCGQENNVSFPVGASNAWLRRAGYAMASLALLQTTVLVTTPFLEVNRGTLEIARRWLVPAKAIRDLDLLANDTEVRGQKLRVLLQHASLANYNRELINWKVDEETYQRYVLSPIIEISSAGSRPAIGLGWRRELWEYFYLPVRHETDPEAAAEIVVKFLRQRLTLVAAGPSTIDEMWQKREADAAGLETLKVASFRSVGIPARLGENKQAELFANGKWQLAS
jgi:hypothetical protein